MSRDSGGPSVERDTLNPCMGLSTGNTAFDFDHEISKSAVYLNASRPNMIFALRLGSRDKAEKATVPRVAASSPRLGIGRRFTLHYSRTQDVAGPSTVTTVNDAGKGNEGHVTGERKADHSNLALKYRKSHDSIKSSMTGSASIFKFAQRRNLTPLPKEIWLPPAQATPDALKVLLVGSSGGGKTTLTKSLEAAFGHYGTAERELYREAVFRNVIQSIETLVRCRDASLGEFESAKEKKVEEQFERDVRFVATIAASARVLGNASFPPDLAGAITRLWEHPSIRTTFAVRRYKRFFLLDSAEYFLDSIDRISQDDYIPSIGDILRSYQKTTGICVSRFKADGRSYNFYDVGGARSERKKWIKSVEDTHALVFLFDSACLGEPLQEQEGDDAMAEQLMLWESIANSHLFAGAHLIVIFTKVDKLTTDVLWRLYSLGLFEPFLAEHPETSDNALRGMAQKLMSLVHEPDHSQEQPRRWVSFWHASIANSTTEMAEVALSALEKLDQED